MEELKKERKTTFGNILFTLNHIYVVDNIFKSHLNGVVHGYTKRNTDICPELSEIKDLQTKMDSWLIRYTEQCNEERLQEMIDFEFVGGGQGAMTVLDILQHLVNHGTYHHGFVSDMMYQIPIVPPANDYPVFLRDGYRSNKT